MACFIGISVSEHMTVPCGLEMCSVLERAVAWGLCQARLKDLAGKETMSSYSIQIIIIHRAKV